MLNIWLFLPKEEGKRFSAYNSTKTQMAESGGSLSENFLRQFRDKVTCMLMSDEKHDDDDDGIWWKSLQIYIQSKPYNP